MSSQDWFLVQLQGEVLQACQELEELSELRKHSTTAKMRYGDLLIVVAQGLFDLIPLMGSVEAVAAWLVNEGYTLANLGDKTDGSN